MMGAGMNGASMTGSEGLDGPAIAIIALCFAWLVVLCVGGLIHGFSGKRK
jgi:hypothetical protein